MNTNKIIWALALCLLNISMSAIPADAQVVMTQIPAIRTFATTGANAVRGVAADGEGTVFFTSENTHTIRKVTAANLTSIAVGSSGVSGWDGDGGSALSAELNSPHGIALDGAGHLYIADTGNHVIRVVNPSTGNFVAFGTTIGPGEIETIAGTGEDDGFSPTELSSPWGVALDSEGNLYIADTGNHAIRKVDFTTGVMTTVAGTGVGGASANGVLALAATFQGPKTVALDARGNIYIGDSGNDHVRVLNTQGGPITLFDVTIASGQIETVVGSTSGNGGNGGVGTSAQINDVDSLIVNAAGDLFLTNSTDDSVRFVNVLTGIISNFAGSAAAATGYSGDGAAATDALLQNPTGLSQDPAGNLFIADTTNTVIRQVHTSAGFPETAIGTSSGGRNMLVQFDDPGVTVNASIPSSSGGLVDYLVTGPASCADAGGVTNCSINVIFQPKYPGLRSVPLLLATSAGSFSVGLDGVGLGPQAVLLPGTITTLAGGFTLPDGVVADFAGNVYVAEGHAVHKIDPAGVVTAFAGDGTLGSSGDSGAATDARLNNPAGLAVDSAGNVYIADSGNNRVRRVDINGDISTFAGGGLTTDDGVMATAALLTGAVGVAVDAAGNAYISSTFFDNVRKVMAGTNVITTVVSSGLSDPTHLALDASGNLYIGDYGNDALKKMDVLGIVTTIATGDGAVDAAVDGAGNLYIAGFDDHTIRKRNAATGAISTIVGTDGAPGATGDNGPASSALLEAPLDVAVDSIGNLYIADWGNGSIRKVSATAATQNFPNTAVNATSAVQNVTLSNIGNQNLVLTDLAAGSHFGISGGSTCTSSTSLASGSTCVVGIVFAPTTSGAKTANATVTDNAFNVLLSTQTVALAGTAAAAGPAATVTTLSSTATPVTYGTSITFTSTTVTAGPSPVTGTGTITFTDTTTSTVLASSVAVDGLGQAAFVLVPAGSYSVVATYVPDADHSTSSSAAVPVTVNKKALTVTAESKTRLYGAANPTFTAVVSGFVRNDNNTTNSDLTVTHATAVVIGGAVTGMPSITSTAVASTPVSSPPITAALGNLLSANYSFSFAANTLTINQAPLSVAINNLTKAYGAAVPTLTGVVTGISAAAGDTLGTTIIVTYDTAAIANSPVSGSPYAITSAVSGSASANYTVTNPAGTLTVTVASQTITFASPGDKTLGDAPFLVSATGGGSVNAVTFSSNTNPVCTVSGSTVTLVIAGTCTIAANQLGDGANYAAAVTVTQSFTVSSDSGPGPTRFDQIITFNSLVSRSPGDPPFELVATGGGSGNAVMFASNTPDVCTVSGNTVTLVGSGTCAIAASQGGSSTYNAAPVVVQSFIVGCSLSNNTGSLPCSGNSTGYTFTNGGGTSFSTAGGGSDVAMGYGIIEPAPGTTAPTAFAIFGFTHNGVLVSEAAVPAMAPVFSGRIHAEINGPVNTGLAFSNFQNVPATISFYLTDLNGLTVGESSFTMDADTQIARFLDQPPFNKAGPFMGTLTFNASVPVGAIALHTFVNERSDFTMTTQTIAPTTPGPSAPLVIAQFASGGGWKTEVILVNPSNQPVSGSVQFIGEGSGSTAATAMTLTVNGQTGESFDYVIPARSSAKLETADDTLATQVGSVRVTPSSGSNAPSGSLLYSFRHNGITVTQASVAAQPAGSTFRSYVESTGATGTLDAVRSGIAITNMSTSSSTIELELTTLSGAATGITGAVTVPPNGHVAMFLDSLFPGLVLPSRGILRMTSHEGGIAVTSLRTRYNVRGDYLITTTPGISELSPLGTGMLVFPHIVNMGGYTTQFVLFGGTGTNSGQGTIQFYDQAGAALTLTDR